MENNTKSCKVRIKNEAPSKQNRHKIYVENDAVKIGNQVWMNKNLAIDDGGEGICSNPAHPEYGCYYTWDAIVRIANTIDGWHLPTEQEWDELEAFCGGWKTAGLNLKAQYGWGNHQCGLDTYGFSILPAGTDAHNLAEQEIACWAYFWTATECGTDEAYYRVFDTQPFGSESNPDSKSNLMCSVRLVQDKFFNVVNGTSTDPYVKYFHDRCASAKC